MYRDKNFGYSGNFHLTKSDTEEILESIRNGLTIEEAVERWSFGLDDFNYNIVQNFLMSRIIECIEEIVEDD